MRLAVVLAVVLAACGGAGAGTPAPSGSLPADARNAPERVDVDGRSYTLEASLNRDFMPIAPSDGRPLAGTIFLRAAALGNAPEGLRAERAWVVNGNEVWETVPEPLQTFTVDRRYHLSLGVRDGPKWKPNVAVDVILRFATASGARLIKTRTEITASM